jgi:hypothetical protein
MMPSKLISVQHQRPTCITSSPIGRRRAPRPSADRSPRRPSRALPKPCVTELRQIARGDQQRLAARLDIARPSRCLGVAHRAPGRCARSWSGRRRRCRHNSRTRSLHSPASASRRGPKGGAGRSPSARCSEHRGVDRMLGHQIGDELVAMDALNSSASWKFIPKKRPATPSQKGDPPASSITPRNSARMRSAKRARWRR